MLEAPLPGRARCAGGIQSVLLIVPVGPRLAPLRGAAGEPGAVWAPPSSIRQRVQEQRRCRHRPNGRDGRCSMPPGGSHPPNERRIRLGRADACRQRIAPATVPVWEESGPADGWRPKRAVPPASQTPGRSPGRTPAVHGALRRDRLPSPTATRSPPQFASVPRFDRPYVQRPLRYLASMIAPADP